MPTTEKEAVTLKPCPFCGGEPRFHAPDFATIADYADALVSCSDCDVNGPSVLVDMSVMTSDDLPDIEAEAIAAWNTRTPSSADVLVEALEQGARWFEEYAVEHEVKARQTSDSYESASRIDKAKRNQERADFLRQALATFRETGRG